MVRKKKLQKNQTTHLKIELGNDVFLSIKGIKGIITDISVAGCKFRTDSIDQMEDLLVKKKGDVTLHFPVIGLDGIRKFKGEIKKVTFDNDLTLGIGFSEIDDDSRNIIKSYIESTLEYRDKLN